jgi:hypothetical protein
MDIIESVITDGALLPHGAFIDSSDLRPGYLALRRHAAAFGHHNTRKDQFDSYPSLASGGDAT